MLGDVFYWVFNMSIAATVCMVPIMLLRMIRRIPRRVFIWLWLVPFIRMSVPVGISSQYGLMALLSEFTTKTVVIYTGWEDSRWTMMNHTMGADSYFPIVYKVNLVEDLFRVASMVWLVVSVAALLCLAVIYAVTMREIKDAKHQGEHIYVSDKIRIPAVYGILRPKIILPLDYPQSDLNYICMHERAHIKRKDNLTRLAAFVVVCVHWFNPFAWLMLKLLYSDMELACDEAVLCQCNDSQRREYAHVLLSTAEKTNVFAASFGGAGIRLRIENVLSYRKISVISGIAFFALVSAVFYVLLTNA